MKLQIKDSGAWRNVLSFDGAHQTDVEVAGSALMQAAACRKTTLRIVDGITVVAYCEAPTWSWRPA